MQAELDLNRQEQKVGLYYTHRIHRPNRLDCRKIDDAYRLSNRKGDKIYLNRTDAVVLRGMLEVALKI